MLELHPTFFIRHYVEMTSLLLCLFIQTKIAGQQVIVNYRAEEKPSSRFTSDGRFLDFPEQIIMATLKATSKASVWTQDSMMFLREGVFADGFRLFAPGLWEYRNKTTYISLTHKLYYGEFEFVESKLGLSPYSQCSEWVIESKQNKNILGIVCTKATRRCSEGEQTVYFARSIPIVDGPIFISVLPGLVLEFDDGKFHYIAQHISANENEISPPKKINLIRDERYSKTETRVVIKKPNITVNSWINLISHYLID